MTLSPSKVINSALNLSFFPTSRVNATTNGDVACRWPVLGNRPQELTENARAPSKRKAALKNRPHVTGICGMTLLMMCEGRSSTLCLLVEKDCVVWCACWGWASSSPNVAAKTAVQHEIFLSVWLCLCFDPLIHIMRDWIVRASASQCWCFLLL